MQWSCIEPNKYVNHGNFTVDKYFFVVCYSVL